MNQCFNWVRCTLSHFTRDPKQELRPKTFQLISSARDQNTSSGRTWRLMIFLSSNLFTLNSTKTQWRSGWRLLDVSKLTVDMTFGWPTRLSSLWRKKRPRMGSEVTSSASWPIQLANNCCVRLMSSSVLATGTPFAGPNLAEWLRMLPCWPEDTMLSYVPWPVIWKKQHAQLRPTHPAFSDKRRGTGTNNISRAKTLRW